MEPDSTVYTCNPNSRTPTSSTANSTTAATSTVLTTFQILLNFMVPFSESVMGLGLEVSVPDRRNTADRVPFYRSPIEDQLHIIFSWFYLSSSVSIPYSKILQIQKNP